MIGEAGALWGLAVSAFTSATLLPGTSEAVLAALHASRAADPLLLLAVASLANTAGSCVNWLMGVFVTRFRDRRWFPASPDQIARAEAWYARYGLWSLLLSWVPVIGDPLTVVAGVLRVPFLVFLAIVAIAKTARYAFVLFLAGLI
ncbi:DedA family protein [Aliihoeflea aestuarii]|jgi:membrane protein YqaA with SNARE-associated domain|uniref:YqaA family protein n=1 Tax=Aliihoeflea aestuarii TaxID=453840 RepID=UPI002093174F|nr:YqaA family protein [Aliihoeflea aestuarii]MCO6389704.1 DedA family protein [Aliihoeflea aestuarii]